MSDLRERLDGILDLGGTKREVIFLVLSGAALLVSVFHLLPLPVDAAWTAVVLCGIPILLEAVIGLVTELDITADVLVACALLASLYIGEIFAAGEVAFIMRLGGLLEDLTVARARAGIGRLVRLTPRTARVLRDGEEITIPAEEVRAGDTLVVRPGETIPADGTIVKGRASIDQSVMTGESLPVDRGPGDDVYSGTTALDGAFEMTASRAGADSSIQRMIRLVRSADAGKAKIVRLADRWAVWIVLAALGAAAAAWAVTGEIVRGVTVLVVFCPCALVLATPTAVMAAIGNATRHGFLVREGDALERLAQVTGALFDKTGTLTHGTPEVVGILSEEDEETVLDLAASAEALSEHPLGKAVVRRWEREHGGGAPPRPDQWRALPGRGAEAVIGGREVVVGGRGLLGSEGIPLPEDLEDRASRWLDEGDTLIHVAADGRWIGSLALADTVREESAEMIRGLHALGIRTALLTGDGERTAAAVAGRLGITEYDAGCLPEDKLRRIDQYEARSGPVCMVGDGINDAPALKRATVGIAMGGIGSDIAADAADIVLVDDAVEGLPHLFALSRRMMRTIRADLVFSMILNSIAVALAATGTLGPVAGALVHNAGSVLVIVNSSRLLGWRDRGRSSRSGSRSWRPGSGSSRRPGGSEAS